MTQSIIVVYVFIGAILGFILAKLTSRSGNKETDIKTELDKTKIELEQQKKELNDHFANSAELLENIYRDYSKLCQIMAKTSTELLPEQSKAENPFAKRLAHALDTQQNNTPVDVELQEAPRDYSEISSGLLKGDDETEKKEDEAKKEVIKEEVVKEEKKDIPEKVE